MKKLIFVLCVFVFIEPVYSDTPATHGMFVFGDHTTYLSHLPMFHAPHDYQLLLEVDLVDDAANPTVEIYQQKKADGYIVFTLMPEVMDLSKVLSGEITTFTAQLFEGHFERSGHMLGSVEVQIKEIIYKRQLNPEGIGLKNEIFVFGKLGRYYGIHLIASKPSFEVIYEIHQPRQKVVNCRRANCDSTINLPLFDQQLPVILAYQPINKYYPQQGDFLRQGVINAKIKSVLYLEVDELSH